jgi:hypothetical protein
MISGLPRSILSFASVSMVCLLGMTKAWSAPPQLDELTSEALKERYGEIEEELAGLAPLMMRTGLGSQGYRSRSLKDAGTIAVQIDFNERQSFDQVVLVPSIWRVGESSYQADGFPEEFRLLVGSGDEEAWKWLHSPKRMGFYQGQLRWWSIVQEVRGIGFDWKPES